jgi:hypothetical protein
VSGQVGAAFSNIGSVTNEIFRALAHGVTQGGLSAIQGNGFMNGALSGAVSSGVGSGIGALGGGPRELILGSGLSGGVANLLNRESFSQGLLSGIFIGAFNHAAEHSFTAYITDKQLKNIYENYPKGDEDDPNYVSRDELFKKIGGPLQEWYEKDPSNLSNTCALRLSYALNKSGYLIPKGKSTYQGADGLNYYILASNMKIHLGNILGAGKSLGRKGVLKNALYYQTGFSQGISGHVDVMFREKAGSNFYNGMQTTYWR